MKKIKKESKVEIKEECKTCNHLEHARDYFHDQYHKEQEKTKALVAAISVLSTELKEANHTIEMLQEDN
jgi:hypothetical protein